MKTIAFTLAVLLTPLPAFAQDAPPVAAALPAAAAPAEQPKPEGSATAPATDDKASMLTGQIRARDQIPADRRQSYIFFRTSRRMGITFLRELPQAEAAAELEAARRMMHQRYEEDMAEWRRVEAACHGDGAAAYRCRRPRPVPEAPNEAGAYSFLTPDRNLYGVDRNGTFTEAEGSYTYLLAIQPGSYVLYGQREPSANIYTGVCLCMGSVRFEVQAGQVVDLGTITFPGLEATAARPSARSAGTTMMENSIVLVPPQAGAALPERLSALTTVPAVLRAAEKQDNVLGLYVDRHPAMPGVLRYERDVVIDERTGREPAPLP